MNKAEKLILKAFMEIEPPKLSEAVLDGRPFFILHDHYAGYVSQLLDGKTVEFKETYLFSKQTENIINREFNCMNNNEKTDAAIYLRMFRLVHDIICKEQKKGLVSDDAINGFICLLCKNE